MTCFNRHQDPCGVRSWDKAEEIEKIGLELETRIRSVPGTALYAEKGDPATS
jgi:hypothetical protein